MQYTRAIDTTWAEGRITVRPGVSIHFEGRVTGVTLDDITLVFHANGDGAYRYAKGDLTGNAHPQTQALIVKHAEQALTDEGFTIDPRVASENYEP